MPLLAELGHVDLWINNAGTNAYKYSLLSECTDDEIVSVVETNMLGVLLCCKEVRGGQHGPWVGWKC